MSELLTSIHGVYQRTGYADALLLDSCVFQHIHRVTMTWRLGVVCRLSYKCPSSPSYGISGEIVKWIRLVIGVLITRLRRKASLHLAPSGL
jgi:hypothetical protein